MALSGLSCGDFMRQKWRLYESNDRYDADTEALHALRQEHTVLEVYQGSS